MQPNYIHPAEYVARHFLDKFNFEAGIKAINKVAIASNVGTSDPFLCCVEFIMDSIHYSDI